MKKSLFMVLLGVVAVPSAYAADKTDGVSPALAVGKIVCERHYIHKPDATVAYQPGVDAQGNSVVPADIAPSPATVPDFMEVPLTAELGKAMKIDLPEGFETKATLGNLKLFRDGRVEFNGQDITAKASEFCGVDLPHDDQTAPVVSPNMNTEPKDPVAGSVAPSQTVEEPKPQPAYELPKGAINVTR